MFILVMYTEWMTIPSEVIGQTDYWADDLKIVAIPTSYYEYKKIIREEVSKFLDNNGWWTSHDKKIEWCEDNTVCRIYLDGKFIQFIGGIDMMDVLHRLSI
mgnify:CR=1 FL=1